MAVPGHDSRDHDFARAHDLPIIEVVKAPGEVDIQTRAWEGDGPLVNSGPLSGLTVAEAKKAAIAWLEERDIGQGRVQYRLRDWLFSRQRYWGEPFPIVHDEVGPIALPSDMLPVDLPDVPDYSPKTYEPDAADTEPEPPLARVPEWVEVELDLGDGPRRYRRDTNTMPNWAGSCWYHLRYLDPSNTEQVVDPQIEKYWMGPQAERGANDPGGVDLYVGGVEHAVLHLLYARFWHKVLFDLGHVSSEEPYYRLFNQGYIQAYAYTDSRGQYVPAEGVVEVEDGAASSYTYKGEPVNREYGKMGKSLKNVVTPDDMYAAYGADTFRVYEMSMGPLDVSRPWETRAVVGSLRFLQRLWRNVISEQTGEVTVVDHPATEETRRAVHRTIHAVRSDMESMRFNTAISRLIELNNHLTKLGNVPREAAEALVLMVAPVAPHVAEELWSRLGHTGSVAHAPFPQADEAMLVEETVTCVVQVAGKVRDRLEVSPAAYDDTLEQLALASEAVVRALDGRAVRKVIVRAPKLVNVVPA
jgi:leucyl-tRNA synthetase